MKMFFKKGDRGLEHATVAVDHTRVMSCVELYPSGEKQSKAADLTPSEVNA